MSERRKEAKREESAASNPGSKTGGDSLRTGLLIGVVALLMISFSNWREISRIQTSLDTQLSQIQKQMGEISTKVNTVSAPPAQRGADPNKVYKVNTAGSPAKGPADAPIVIAEFSDFQCPFCSRVGPTLKKVQEVYGDQVRISWKHNPLDFHKDAPLAHMASVAADNQGKFWEYHDLLFANQKAIKQDNLKEYAKQLNLDMAKFDKDLLDLENNKKIEADKAEARSLGASGTPSFFINGRLLKGAKPFEAFADVINAELVRLKLPVPTEAKAN